MGSPHIGRTHERHIGFAVGARHFGPVADDRKIVAALQELAILHGQVTPPVRVRGGSGDLGARMDPVHLARLRKGEETFVVDMIQEMLFSREPEALFDIVKLLPKRSEERRVGKECVSTCIYLW